MASVIGGIGTSLTTGVDRGRAVSAHADQISEQECLDRLRPDVVLLVYSDRGLNFTPLNMPTFAVGAPGDGGAPDFALHLITSLIRDEFDIATCQEMKVATELTQRMRHVNCIPIHINTAQQPLPSPSRCFALGRSLGYATTSYSPALNILVIGASDRRDGASENHGEFHRMFQERLIDDPESLARYSVGELVRQGGVHGASYLTWLTMRGAMGGRVRQLHKSGASAADGCEVLLLGNA